MYDIVIIGAGPAGSILAQKINKKYKTLLIDNKDFKNSKSNIKKCCGGLLAPDAQKILGELGLALPKDILVNPQLFAVRTMDFQNNLERNYQRFYLNFDRHQFDHWLFLQIPKTVEISQNSTFVDYKQEIDHIKIKFQKNNLLKEIKTKILIDASGAGSILRRKLTPNSLPKAYVAIQEWFEQKNNLPYFSAIFDREITDFYSWTIPKNNYLLIGSALEQNQNPQKKFEKLKSKLRKKGFKFNKKIKREGAIIFRPQKPSQIFFGHNNIAFAGEASGLISPSSAEGLSFAIKSSITLADAVNSNPENFLKIYKKNCKKLKTNILFKNLKSPFMYNNFLRKLVIKSGLLSMKNKTQI